MLSPDAAAIADEASRRRSDKPLSQAAVEEGYRLHEEQVQAARLRHLPGQERWIGKENEERRLVNILHPHEIFRRLRNAGVDARTESPEFFIRQVGNDGVDTVRRVLRTTGRLWLNSNSVRGLVGVNAWVRDEEMGERVARTVTSFQYPYGPEWSLFHFDKFGVATSEKYRGWRTVFLNLIIKGVLTEDEVTRAMGPVAFGSHTLYYRQQLQDCRHRRMQGAA